MLRVIRDMNLHSVKGEANSIDSKYRLSYYVAGADIIDISSDSLWQIRLSGPETRRLRRILGFSFGLCFPEDMGNPNESRLHMHDLDRPCRPDTATIGYMELTQSSSSKKNIVKDLSSLAVRSM